MERLPKIIGAAGAAAAAMYLSKSENREKLKGQLNHVMKKVNSASPSIVPYETKLGKPVDIDDAKMVDEGALTSIKYYNEQQEKLP